MSLFNILNVIGNAFSGVMEISQLTYVWLKKFGILLTRYKQDVEDAGMGSYDPKEKEKHFLSKTFLIKYLGEKNQLRAKKVIDFLMSPSFLHILGVISIGFMFLSPLGPIAAGVAAAISFTMFTANFAYQSYKLRKTTMRKMNFSLLEEITNRRNEITLEHAKGKISDEMMAFYKTRVVKVEENITQNTTSKNRKTRMLLSDATSNFLESAIILISSILSFNIPSGVIGGIAIIGNTIDKASKANAEAQAMQKLIQDTNAFSKTLGIPVKTNMQGIRDLHERSLKHNAFLLTYRQLHGPFDRAKFEKTYQQNLDHMKSNSCIKDITFLSSAKNNFVGGFSLHRSANQHSPVVSENEPVIRNIRNATLKASAAVENRKVDFALKAPTRNITTMRERSHSFVEEEKHKRESAKKTKIKGSHSIL